MRKASLISLLGLSVLLLFSLTGCGDDASDKDTLVISTWGFNEDIFWENVFTPFEEEHDVEIELVVGNNSERLNEVRMRAEEGQDQVVDVIYLAENYAIQGRNDGLFAEINRENIPNLEEIYEIGQAPLGEEYGPAYTIGSYGLVYDSEEVDMEVESWTDLWNEEFEGRVSMPEINTTAGPLNVVIAAEDKQGVTIQDEDEAFEALKDLDENVLEYYGRSSELVNMFTQGEVLIAGVQDFAFEGIKDGLPSAEWVDPVEGTFVNRNVVNVVEGTENQELAEEFINFLLSEEVQERNALDKLDSPINKNVELTEEEAEGLTYGEDVIESLRTTDSDYIVEHTEEWSHRWNRELSQ
ncbi:ABC transporter substrate-binding protein [Natranaerobius trueperi]|uniref:Spermidine/putrescine ABC transporter substrate-binding protein n=1 Tax=Natranaerobius trueperi TaxID=759412 RepID=A0A226BW06_9FIRM|nr:ABC transporter substrate-binding protein [Natranaerobius trueperi]OWZ83173.1 spermidine/putrescine ABC transporter substrate-binding protein [Natranaerobius trueperi]